MPRKPAKKPAAPAKVTASQANIAKALADLGINKPYYTARVVGGRLELHLYGGDVCYWPKEVSEDTSKDTSKEET